MKDFKSAVVSNVGGDVDVAQSQNGKEANMKASMSSGTDESCVLVERSGTG